MIDNGIDEGSFIGDVGSDVDCGRVSAGVGTYDCAGISGEDPKVGVTVVTDKDGATVSGFSPSFMVGAGVFGVNIGDLH
jgi:hypothetical protein